jgi:hypothetical protein
MNDKITSTSVHLQAMKVVVRGGKYEWRWIVTGFGDGETYQDGKKVEVNTHADSFDGLFNK